MNWFNAKATARGTWDLAEIIIAGDIDADDCDAVAAVVRSTNCVVDRECLGLPSGKLLCLGWDIGRKEGGILVAKVLLTYSGNGWPNPVYGRTMAPEIPDVPLEWIPEGVAYDTGPSSA